MYTKSQKQLLSHIKKLVAKLFFKYPVPAHDEPHARRVATWARFIAARESGNVFLCEVAGWVHDIGRVTEYYRNDSRRHHELSYEMLLEWFQNDRAFDVLTKKEKAELMYAVRYHWNDAADRYFTAIILRDADKIDIFGKIGIQRMKEFYHNNKDGLSQHLLKVFYMHYWVRTKTAQKIIKRGQLFDPIERYYRNFLRVQIKNHETKK